MGFLPQRSDFAKLTPSSNFENPSILITPHINSYRILIPKA